MNYPNIVIFCSDEHARQFAKCYGNGTILTPTLNTLSAQGTTYDRAYTPSPICVPARASLATGLQVNETRCWSSAEPYCGEPESWMHRLTERGHTVISFGKLHFRSSLDNNGFSQEILPMHVANSGLGWPQSLLHNPLPPFEQTRELAAQIGRGESDYTNYDRRITSAACNWLCNESQKFIGNPWVLFVSFVSPHYPLIAPPEFYDLYSQCMFDDFLHSFENNLPKHPVLDEIRRFWNYDNYFDDKKRKEARRCYYGLVSFLDNNIRKVLNALETHHNMNETVVLYTSDHGEMLGHLGFWTKSVMYEDAVGVPLIATGPGFKSERSAVPVSLTDISATVDYALGYKPANNAIWAAQPLQTINPDLDRNRFVISQYHDGGTPVSFYMVVKGDWKYVYYSGGYPPQLFNLASDPRELNDLADNPSMTTHLKSMHKNLLQVLEPEHVAEQCAADQATKINSLGGREAIMSLQGFNHTPVE